MPKVIFFDCLLLVFKIQKIFYIDYILRCFVQLFISSDSLIDTLEFSKHKLMSSTNRKELSSFFVC